MMNRALEIFLKRLIPGSVRYFHVGDHPTDKIAPGLATIIRKTGSFSQYLYLEGGNPQDHEPHPETPFHWGPPIDWDMYSYENSPMKREITELEAYIMIRRAAS